MWRFQLNLAQQLFDKGFSVDRVKHIVTMIAGSPETKLDDAFAAMIPLDIRISFLKDCWKTIEEYDTI